MDKQSKQRHSEFIKWFGPTLDALRQLGGSGRPKEVVEQIAKNLSLPDHFLEETMKSGTLRFANQVAWARQFSNLPDVYIDVSLVNSVFLPPVDPFQKALHLPPIQISVLHGKAFYQRPF